MISPTDPDKAFTINGVEVTGRQLAEARQELSHRGVHNPHWAELSQHDQDMAALSAGNWLRALADLVPTADDAGGYACDGCQEQADYWDEDGAPRCNRCKAFDKATASAPVVGRDRVTDVPLCEHNDDAEACQLTHRTGVTAPYRPAVPDA